MITNVRIRGFRGISGVEEFAPETITILTGRNGLGKTTFFDAVDWCLFGEASRFGPQQEQIRNLYSSASPSVVEVTITLGSQAVLVRRTPVSLTLDGSTVSERELAEALIVDTAVFPPYLRELGRQVRTVTYLPQQEIRDFVNASLSTERRALLHGLLGVPNAGIVDSSIKRLRDNFATREKSLIEEVDDIDGQLRQLTSSVEFDSRVEGDLRDFLESFQYVYSGRANTIEDLRSTLEKELITRENEADVLNDALSAHRETVAVTAQASKERQVLEERRLLLTKTRTDADIRNEELSVSVNEALASRQQATRDLGAAESRLATLSNSLSKQQRLRELGELLARLDGERENIVSERSALEKSVELTRVELVTNEQQSDEYRTRTRIAREREGLERRNSEIDQRLKALESERRQNEESLTTVSMALAQSLKLAADAKAARAVASDSHERVLSSAQRAAQIADLRNKLATLVAPGDSRCPLCGAEYETHDSLINHIAAQQGNAINDELRRVRDALSSAESEVTETEKRENAESKSVNEYRASVQRLEREITELKAQQTTLALSLQALPMSSEVGPSVDVLTRGDELRAALETIKRSILLIDDRLRVIDRNRSAIASDGESLKPIDASPEDVTVEIVAKTRADVAVIQKKVDGLDRDLRDLRNTQSSVQSQVLDLRSQIASTEAQLSALGDRTSRAHEDLARRCRALDIVSTDLTTINEELQRRAQDQQTRVEGLRGSLNRAKAIERRLLVNQTAVRQLELQRRLSEIHEGLAVLKHARNNFQEIAGRLTARSKRESDSAATLHLAAIQRCLNDLYPHRHLNEVEIDFAEGELLVKDRWLSKAVRPESYSSTGQANVLGLSVFLGLALRQSFSRARFLLLDEPVQNLDDLHFLAFLTLLKRVALTRQVIISTADSNFAEILRRHLGSWSGDSRKWCEYEWLSFQPESGPRIRRRDVKHRAVA